MWPEATNQSQSICGTSTGKWGTLWQASTKNFAPYLWAILAISCTGLIQPKALEICTTETNFVFSEMSCLNCSKSKVSSGVSSTNFRTAPVFWATNCQGTILLWCSITERIISSPGCKLFIPQLYATKLIASLALRV